MLSISNIKLAIIVSDFNQNITEKLLTGAILRLSEFNLTKEQITVTHVPGAVEIPLIAKILAQSGNYDAIICLGAVIQGETDHYQYVCQQVSQGCQQVMLEYALPVVFGVLTTQTELQAEERAGGLEGNKGSEAAETAIKMIDLIKTLQ